MTNSFISVDVKKFAGGQTFSVELLDRSSPAFFDELVRQMEFAYAKETDRYVMEQVANTGTLNATGQNEETETDEVQTNSIPTMIEEPVQQQTQPDQMNSPNHQLEQLQKLQQLKAQKLSEKLK